MGSFGTYQGSASASGPVGGGEGRLELHAGHSDGDFTYVYDPLAGTPASNPKMLVRENNQATWFGGLAKAGGRLRAWRLDGLFQLNSVSRGLAGTIIDGPVRDPVEIRDLEYPVFCRDFNPRRAAKEAYGRINVPVTIGMVTVNPGDVVRADANGIVCIPSARLPETVQLASEVLEKENSIKDQILSGRTIFEIFELQQYVASAQPQAGKKL